MPTLKLVIVPAKILSDGKHKVRISVSHNSQTRYIPTDCIIDDLSQFKEGQVVNRSDASYMNMKLRKKLIFYQETLDKIYDPDLYTCTDLVTLLLQKKDYRGITFSQKADEYITQLVDNGQGKSAKLYRNAVNSFLKSQRDVNLAAMSPTNIRTFEQYMKQKLLSSTTMNIYLTLIQCIINSAKKHKEVIYETEPFEFCNKPSINSRELDLSVEELKTIRDMKIDKYNVNVVRDIFMLSYYMGGMNLVDLLSINFKKLTVVDFSRKKTGEHKKGINKTSFTIQPEAKAIIDKYINKSGKLVFGKFNTFGKCYSVIARKMEELAHIARIDRRVVYYSARKSFVQHGYDLGISLEVLEYCVGHSMKSNRPIFNYLRIMREHADKAIRTILDNIK